MLILRSSSLNVYRNLAVEEYLTAPGVPARPVLFLWRSAEAVVIGKNQNPWRECRLDRMQQDGVALARRISGGGAVYHDEGNLNYCVVVPRVDYEEARAFTMVEQALATLGVRMERRGRSNLCCDGLKFSGNAFCFRNQCALHHGTLLLKADLQRLGRYLGPCVEGIETRAIASVPAVVANLERDVEAVSHALEAQFIALYGAGTPVRRASIESLPGDAIAMLEARQRSDAWRLGATPPFAVEWRGVRLRVEKGLVVEADGPDGAELEGGAFWGKGFSPRCEID